MFLPPNNPVSSKPALPRNQVQSPFAGSFLAGIAFCVVRLAASLPFILYMSELENKRDVWVVAGIESGGAGLVAAVLTWLLWQQEPTKSRGALIGLVSAIGSYAFYLVFSITMAGVVGVNSVAMFVIKSAGREEFSAILVIPLLVIWGICLSTMRNSSNPSDDAKS
jgi:hypothetical protein